MILFAKSRVFLRNSLGQVRPFFRCPALAPAVFHRVFELRVFPAVQRGAVLGAPELAKVVLGLPEPLQARCLAAQGLLRAVPCRVRWRRTCVSRLLLRSLRANGPSMAPA